MWNRRASLPQGISYMSTVYTVGSNISLDETNCLLFLHKIYWEWIEQSILFQDFENFEILNIERKQNQLAWTGSHLIISTHAISRVRSFRSILVWYISFPRWILAGILRWCIGLIVHLPDQNVSWSGLFVLVLPCLNQFMCAVPLYYIWSFDSQFISWNHQPNHTHIFWHK